MSTNKKFNPSDLTLGEVAAVEDLSGRSIDSLGEEGSPKGKLLAAIAYVVKRRQDPTFTFNQALGLSLSEVENIVDFGDDDDDDDDDQASAKTVKKGA